jgi:hypothetical protein
MHDEAPNSEDRRKLYNKAYYENNKPTIKAYAANYYQNNKDKWTTHRQNNLTKVREYQAEWVRQKRKRVAQESGDVC